eukprot:CAMPEP_0197445372 /NCGR_PEP_ID=MMETSP1175-20131217/10606_1 /TAXON_ID=1003142 /ORGANISM="Triceratium dubium, Strain CCMP147" /LENGTH=143 /DNA_ID=CAMNT_0042976319 /DNA_START=109 /DNA_END=536 /DNA_ORIENTATION=+
MPIEINWFGIGAAECRDVNAPCDVLWDVVTDIDKYPLTLTTVQSIKRVDGSDAGTPLRPGTKWRQTRDFPKGTENVVEMTVRAIEECDGNNECVGPYPKSLTITGEFDDRSAMTTITLTVESAMESNTNGSRLVATFGLVPDG